MRMSRLNTALTAAALMLWSGLAALGEIRTSLLQSAIPQMGIQVYYCSAFRAANVKDLPFYDRNNITAAVTGGHFAVKFNPQLEGSVWLSGNGDNTEVELQAKILLRNIKDAYLSVGPTLITSDGKKHYTDSYQYDANYGRVDKCYARGFGIPLIYAWDTHRGLLLTASAGINCEWVKIWGQYKQYNTSSGTYDTHYYNYDILPVVHGQANFNMVAKYGIFTLIPEFGVTLADAKDQGFRSFLNYGLSIGADW